MGWSGATGWITGPVAAAILVLFAGQAFPHAGIVATTPQNGAVLQSPPEDITVEFTEAVTLVAVRLFDASATELALRGPPLLMDRVLTFGARDPLPDGTYAASVRVTSEDGHPVGTTFVFDVGNATLSEREQDRLRADLDSDPWRLSVLIARGLFYAATLFVVGFALFLALVGVPASLAPKACRLLRGGAMFGLLSAVPFLALSAVQLQGADPRAIDLVALRDAAFVGANFDRLMIALPAFVVIYMTSLTAELHWARRVVFFVAATGLASSFAMASHVTAMSDSKLAAQAIITAHIAFGAFWIGSLLPLFIILGHEERFLAVPYFRRFSAIAGIGIVVIAATGGVVIWRLFQDPSEILTSDYGKILGAKIALIAGLLLIAAFNRFVWTPRFVERTRRLAALMARQRDSGYDSETVKLALEAQGPVRSLRRSILFDMILAIGVAAATAGLSFFPP